MTNPFLYYYISYFFTALILALTITPLVRPLAFRLGALDHGAGRRAHRGIVPRLGGIGIWLAFVLPIGFSLVRGQWDGFHHNLTAILMAGTLVFAIGVYDDLRGAPIRNKLGAEILAAGLLYWWGIRIQNISVPFVGKTLSLGWLSLPVTVLWIVIITNAFNLIDGLDGLAAGTGILIAAMLFLVGGGDTHLRLVFIVLIGALFGFLRHNFPPATIFMGDSGSLFVGFVLASITIVSSYKATAMATMMVPIIAYAHPLMDMIYSVLRRYYRGVPLGEADREHIHHKLLEKGMSRRRVLLTLYLINFVVMSALLLLINKRINFPLAGLAFFILAGIVGMRLLGYIEFKAFARENLRNLEIGRKRRYCSYIIKRFSRGVEQAHESAVLQRLLTELFSEYGLLSAEISLMGTHFRSPVYRFSAGPVEDQTLNLEFPIMDGPKPIGRAVLKKGMHDDNFLCTAELARAISDGIANYARRRRAHQ